MDKEAEQNKELYKIRHTLAHLLAKAVLEVDPEAKLAIGPPVDNGFYYDFEFSEGFEVTDKLLKTLQKSMRKSLQKGFTPEVHEVSAEEAKEMFKNQPYKLELIEEFSKNNEPITVYDIAGFTDLCEGPHVSESHEIDARAFELNKIAGAYWRGNENNKMLTRIYGVAFKLPTELDEYKNLLEEAKKRDHRKLGQELGLFTFSELVGPGLPLWTPKGTLLRNLITQRIAKIQSKLGYQEVTIPHITKNDLYKTSGHWEKFGDELFKVKGKSDAEFVMKPMNCPHHTQIFASAPRSYKELPIRYSETTMVYRDEQAGELLGLARVRSITQDDGHVFCTKDQIKDEIANIISVIRQFYTALDMFEPGKFWVSISVRDKDTPDKYLGDPAVWDHAESLLEEIAKENKFEYKVVPGEAAFYGPKIDFMFFDALGRERQLATAQLDFVMPGRFGLEYTDENSQRQTPVMIHRAIAGSLERFIAVMLEHFAGKFPTWLSPEQVRVLPVADVHSEYAHHVLAGLEKVGLRATLHEATDSLGKRVRNAKKSKIPYLLVLGDKELESHKITVEHRDGTKDSTTLNEFIDKILEEIA